MNFKQYETLLACSTITYEASECAVCLESLAPGNPQSVAATASCRMPCGHVFHHGCALQCYDSRRKMCPLCRTDFYPKYPTCFYCAEAILPTSPVTTLQCCGTMMHMLCAQSWLEGCPSVGDVPTDLTCTVCREINAQAERELLATCSSSSDDDWSDDESITTEGGDSTANSSDSEDRSRDSEDIESRRNLPIRHDDDEVLVLGEVRRGPPTRWRSRSPIWLD